MNPTDTDPQEALPPGLASLESTLVARLDDEQGRWRRRPLLVRALQVALPVVVVVSLGVLLLPGSAGVAGPVVGAVVAAALALAAVTVAPQRPGMGERLAQIATVVAGIAFVLELAPMAWVAGNSGMGCLSIASVMALLASSATAAILSLSGLPLRPWHRAGLAVAAVLGACSVLWHHCAADSVVHVVVGHTAGPALVGVLLFLGLGWRRRRAVVPPGDVG